MLCALCQGPMDPRDGHALIAATVSALYTTTTHYGTPSRDPSSNRQASDSRQNTRSSSKTQLPPRRHPRATPRATARRYPPQTYRLRHNHHAPVQRQLHPGCGQSHCWCCRACLHPKEIRLQAQLQEAGLPSAHWGSCPQAFDTLDAPSRVTTQFIPNTPVARRLSV